MTTRTAKDTLVGIVFCKENQAHYRVPKFVKFRDSLPKTLVGKVLRRALVEEELKRQAGD